MPHSDRPYIGRFAPSPTGPLHAGSLVAAVASYLDAMANAGLWLLRIEDVDTHRTVAGAESDIKRSLEQHGLFWDAEAPAQSTRSDRYEQVLDILQSAGHTYFCNCPRKQLRQHGSVYPGTCRGQQQVDYQPATARRSASHAIRFDTSHFNEKIEFDDAIFGRQIFCCSALGDFVVRRRDSLFAYQLAVTSDDIDQHVSHVVRGSDLLPSTPWQLMLYQSLGAQAPTFAHLPLVINATDGTKLSKQTGATRVDDHTVLSNLANSLKVLGQHLPDIRELCTAEELLAHAAQHWNRGCIPVEAVSQ